MIHVGADRRIRWFSATAENLFNLRSGDVGRSIKDTRLPLYIPHLEQLTSEVLGRDAELTCEARLEDGRLYNVRILPYKARDQDTNAVVIVLADLTSLKREMEEMRKQAVLSAAVLESAKDLLVVVLDGEGRIVRFNVVCEQLTGYSADEVTGRRVWDFLLIPEEVDAIRKVFGRLLTGASPARFENYWVKKNGEHRLIAWSNSISLRNDGSVEYVIGTGIDITDVRQAIDEAQESQATVAALLETAAQAILSADEQGRIVLCNATATTMFGYERQDLLGREIEDLVPKRSREKHKIDRAAFFRQPRNRAMGVGLDLSGVRKDGTEFPVEVSLSHVQTRQGTFAVAFVSDITERKRIADALRASEERLRGLTARLFATQEEERKRMARDLHDDFNQRIGILAVEVAEIESGLPESSHSLRERLLNVEARLTEVSDDLRRTAYQLHPSVLEHLGLPAALQDYCEHVSTHSSIKVHFTKHSVPSCIPEPAALCLYRVAQESLRNVIKHSGANRAFVELLGKKGELILIVRDTGRGFDPKEQSIKGGLGLISIEERARLIGGGVSITSRPGSGTCVTISAPLRRGVQR